MKLAELLAQDNTPAITKHIEGYGFNDELTTGYIQAGVQALVALAAAPQDPEDADYRQGVGGYGEKANKPGAFATGEDEAITLEFGTDSEAYGFIEADDIDLLVIK